jgi:colanic acid/amylovoran biosynthesis glycosyltransferase
MTATKRIGYLVPEFPGQTHIFFWRELQVLKEMRIDACLLSTRLPKANIISHSWATDLIARTTYLSAVTPVALFQILWTLLRAGPRGWWRAWRVSGGATELTWRQRLTTVALVPAGARLAALARQRGFAHVHVHSCANAANVAMIAARLGGPSYSITLHGGLDDYGPNQANKWRHAAFGIVITKRLKAEVERRLAGALPRYVAIAPMGVDMRRFHRENPYVPWRSDGPLRLFACGRLNPCKGHEDLIKAVSLLSGRGIDVKLEIAGEDDGDGTYRRQLVELIGSLGVTTRVTLLGAVSEQRILTGLLSAHVFCLASLQEPLGVAIMEGMAMSLPVVVTRAGGVPELVDDGVDGILVDVQQPEQIAVAVARLAQDPTLATTLGAAGKQKIAREFHARLSAETLVRLVQETGGLASTRS